MKLLLDTHLLLWTLADDPKLSEDAKAHILNPKNSLYCSVASFWEFSLKAQKNPEAFDFGLDLFSEWCDNAAFGRYDVRTEHVLVSETLRLREGASRHKDPFDRMLIAQAKAEGATLLTHDRKMTEYDEACVLLV